MPVLVSLDVLEVTCAPLDKHSQGKSDLIGFQRKSQHATTIRPWFFDPQRTQMQNYSSLNCVNTCHYLPLPAERMEGATWRPSVLEKGVMVCGLHQGPSARPLPGRYKSLQHATASTVTLSHRFNHPIAIDSPFLLFPLSMRSASCHWKTLNSIALLPKFFLSQNKSI